MSAAVVLDVPAIEASAAASALSTCNAALGAERCALAGPNREADWYAVVRFDPQRAAVLRIELHRGDASGAEVAASQLEFKERDAARERWASAGVVVAALVAAQHPEPNESAPAPPAARPAAAPVRPAPPPAPARRMRYIPRLELGATGGSESEHATLRLGGLARFGMSFSQLPVFALGSIAYAARASGEPDMAWFTGSLGFGVRVEVAARAAFELRSEAVLETVSIRASDGTRSGQARRTRWGPRLGLDLNIRVAERWIFVIGAEAAALRPEVVVDVGGSTVDRLPPFAWGFISLLRYDFR